MYSEICLFLQAESTQNQCLSQEGFWQITLVRRTARGWKVFTRPASGSIGEFNVYEWCSESLWQVFDCCPVMHGGGKM